MDENDKSDTENPIKHDCEPGTDGCDPPKWYPRYCTVCHCQKIPFYCISIMSFKLSVLFIDCYPNKIQEICL